MAARAPSYFDTDACHSRSISAADLTPCVGASGSGSAVCANTTALKTKKTKRSGIARTEEVFMTQNYRRLAGAGSQPLRVNECKRDFATVETIASIRRFGTLPVCRRF